MRSTIEDNPEILSTNPEIVEVHIIANNYDEIDIRDC